MAAAAAAAITLPGASGAGQSKAALKGTVRSPCCHHMHKYLTLDHSHTCKSVLCHVQQLGNSSGVECLMVFAAVCSSVPLIRSVKWAALLPKRALAQQNGRAHEFKFGQRLPRLRKRAAELIVIKRPAEMYKGLGVEQDRTQVDHKFCDTAQ
jgi:hypothetical protein